MGVSYAGKQSDATRRDPLFVTHPEGVKSQLEGLAKRSLLIPVEDSLLNSLTLDVDGGLLAGAAGRLLGDDVGGVIGAGAVVAEEEVAAGRAGQAVRREVVEDRGLRAGGQVALEERVAVEAAGEGRG